MTTDCQAVTTCTMDELVDNGRTITVGDKIYDRWQIFDGFPDFPFLSPRVRGDAVAFDLSRIVIEPVELDPLHHILRFDLGDEVVAPGGDVDSEVFIPFGDVVRTVDGAARIHDNVL